jgi:galactokinase
VRLSKLLDEVFVCLMHNQPGGYACSTKEIDYIVDVVNQIDGVIGAQLAGAGLGGCVMILAKENSVNEVIQMFLVCRQMQHAVLPNCL